jgi:hypothetical protein
MTADTVRAPSTTLGSTLKHIVDEYDGLLAAIKRQHRKYQNDTASLSARMAPRVRDHIFFSPILVY